MSSGGCPLYTELRLIRAYNSPKNHYKACTALCTWFSGNPNIERLYENSQTRQLVFSVWVAVK